MLVPVRCFSCNKVIGGHYEQFIERRENGEDPGVRDVYCEADPQRGSRSH